MNNKVDTYVIRPSNHVARGTASAILLSLWLLGTSLTWREMYQSPHGISFSGFLFASLWTVISNGFLFYLTVAYFYGKEIIKSFPDKFIIEQTIASMRIKPILIIYKAKIQKICAENVWVTRRRTALRVAFYLENGQRHETVLELTTQTANSLLEFLNQKLKSSDK